MRMVRMRSVDTVVRVGLIVLLAWAAAPAAGPGEAAGQVESASPVVPGTGFNHSAFVRGYGSVGLNPAGLALPGTPGWSVSFPSVGAGQSLGPVTLSDLNAYSGSPVSAERREIWLESIEASGAQSGGGRSELSVVSLNVGPFGFQFSGTATARADLAPDAAELLLFGNAGRTGEARDFSLEGSRFDASAHSSVSVSYGQALDVELMGMEEEALALGVTTRWVTGHALVLGRDLGSEVGSDPLQVGLDWPVVHTRSEAGAMDGGTGVALDLGASWEGGPWAASLAIRDAVNTFSWDESSLEVRPGAAFFDGEHSETDFDPVAFDEASAAIRTAVSDMTFGPTVILGTGYRPAENLSLSADFRQQLGDGILHGPETHLGLGAEYRPDPVIPVRAGVAYITGGFRVGGGLGLAIGPVNLAGAGLYESGDEGDGAHVSLGFSIGAP